MIYEFIAICVIGGALAEVPIDNCPNVSPIQDFNKTAFIGKWYEVASSDRSLVLPCYSFNISVDNGGNYVEHEFLKATLWESFKDTPMELNINDGSFETTPRKPAVFPLPDGGVLTLPEIILGTDYTTYAVFYRCQDDKPIVSISGRDSFREIEVLEEAHQVLIDNGIDDVELFLEKPICNDLRLASVKKN